MGSVGGGVFHAWRSAVDYINDRRRTNALKREFWDLGVNECGAILYDLGLTSQDFDEAMQRPYASRDLSVEALKSLGMDRTTFREPNGTWSRGIHRTCMLCLDRRRCLRELTAGTFASNYRQFCPNSEDFDIIIGDPEAGVHVKPAA